tara:strand:- start:3352 stop:3507 length:156 start_codon:yes stop_codon:yes gene_type:complete
MKKIFTESKTFYGFQDKEVADQTLVDFNDIVKNTLSFNCLEIDQEESLDKS